MRRLLPLVLTGCGGHVSEPLLATIDRSEVVPGEVIEDPGDDGGVDSGTDTDTDADGGGDTGEPFTGGCLELFGEGDRFAGGDASLPQGGDARTVEFWFKNENITGVDAVVAWGASGYDFEVGFYNGFPMAKAGASRVYGTTQAISDGTWHHLGVAWDPGAGTVSFWIDGVLDTTQPLSVSTSAGGLFHLGDDVAAGSGGNFVGVLDEVHVWSRTLREGEFGGLYTEPPPALVAWYDMNQEGAGSDLTLVNQGTGSGLDLTSLGDPAFVPCKY